VRRRLAEIAAVAGRPGDGPDPQVVARYGAFVGQRVLYYPTLVRSMATARELIRTEASAGRAMASGTVLLAGQLVAGKGRFRRAWHAPQGGLWGCLIHGNIMLPESRRFIPYAAGVAGCETVREAGAAAARLRWVNDILVGGGKLAGFLVEGFTEPIHGEEFDLVGFGINVNNTDFPGELAGSAVALAQVVQAELALNWFAELFLARLAWNFGLLYHEEARQLRGDGFSGPGGGHLLLARWRQLSDTIGRRVLFGHDVVAAPQYQALVTGLDSDGGLELRLPDGNHKSEYCGEVRYCDDNDGALQP
jgi:BirA family transcriptional regulator, biotin operon repressor / biotin---[acetyl-CoA-carboxylase] ligase